MAHQCLKNAENFTWSSNETVVLGALSSGDAVPSIGVNESNVDWAGLRAPNLIEHVRDGDRVTSGY